MDINWLPGKVSGILRRIRQLFFPRPGEQSDPVTRYLAITLVCAGVLAALSLWVYNRTHLFDDYAVAGSSEQTDVEGTEYAMLSGRVIKIGHDGVFCVSTSNEMFWSAAYSIQTPIYDSCRGTMVIAEQHGSQVYVLNSKGIVGSFTTTLPVLKARVAANGVVALVQDDVDDVTWINLFDKDGTALASVKATWEETGYPLDLALSADAKQMLVSYAGTEGMELAGKICVYDFRSAMGPDEEHLTGSLSYPGTLFPDVGYAAASVPVAVADDGFAVFSSGKELKERRRVSFEEEIVSTFADEDHIGFIFRSGQSDHKYRMELYGYTGKRTMQTEFDFEYTSVRMKDGEVLLCDASNLNVYRASGRPKLKVTYDKEVKYFTGLNGLKEYLVVTGQTMDRIRIR